MGAIADAIATYAQPLLDATDGSQEQVNKALTISQACWNLALLSEQQRDEALANVQSALGLGDEEFVTFRRSVLDPMISRHREMFPRMHERAGKQVPPHKTVPALAGKYSGTGWNAPCPCNSGRRHKRCCGRS
jgi:uncharacterized protein YecA (UPF0149 family)